MVMMGFEQGDCLYPPFGLINFLIKKGLSFLAHQFVAFFEAVTAQVKKVRITYDLLQEPNGSLRHHGSHNTSADLIDHCLIYIFFIQKFGSKANALILMLGAVEEITDVMKPAGRDNDKKVLI